MMRIGIDFDDVLVEFIPALCEYHNKRYKTIGKKKIFILIIFGIFGVEQWKRQYKRYMIFMILIILRRLNLLKV
jgi:hypothetical protein